VWHRKIFNIITGQIKRGGDAADEARAYCIILIIQGGKSVKKTKFALSKSAVSKFFVLTAAFTLVWLGGVAHAAFVNYTVDGWSQQFPAPTTPPANAPHGSNGYPGDTVALQTYTTTTDILDLTPGTYTQKINTLLWTIDYTYGGTATDPNAWSNLSFGVNTTRGITFDGGATGSFSQTGLLEVTYDNDYLQLYSGGTITLLVQGYNIAITPLGLAEVGGSNFSGGNPWAQPSRDVMAEFVITAAPVPLPPAVWLMGSGLLGLIGIRRRFKK